MVLALFLTMMIGNTAVAETSSDERFVIGDLHGNYFCDPEYARKSWDTLQTLPQLKAERAKYAAAYEAWVEKYLKDPRPSWKKLKELRQIPMDDPICRGYDLRVMYGGWQEKYATWQKNPRKPSTETFEVWRNKNESCEAFEKRTHHKPGATLDICGPLPDWRSE